MILAQSTRDDIRRLNDVWVARLAFEYRCERADVLAIIHSQPVLSQPPAVVPPVAEAPEEEQTGGAAPASPVTSSQAKASEDSGTTDQAHEIPADSVTGDASRSSVGGGTDAFILPETADDKPEAISFTGSDPQRSLAAIREDAGLIASAAGADKSGEAEASPAPAKTSSVTKQVYDLHIANPDMGPKEIAALIGGNLGTVKAALSKARAATALLRPTPTPEPTPQEPVAPPPPRTGTLTERVRILHQQHPTWTARMIANELGAPYSSVSTLLATARKSTAPEPEFTGAAQLKEHYGDVAKRLGKPS